LLFQTRQFIGNDGRIINYYAVSQAVFDREKRKWVSNEIYGSTSMLRITMYLRDLWYLEQGKELPDDQELWNVVRKGLMKDGKYGAWHHAEVSDRECQ